MSKQKKIKNSRPEELLREASEALKKRSAGMSLRAVATRLEISPSYWSKILRGEKPLAQNLLPKVVKVLGMDAQQIAQLQRSILEMIETEKLAPATGLTTSRETADSPIENYRNLGREDFWLLQEWYFIPVLNLFTLIESPANSDEISQRLGITSIQVSETLRKLVQHGFLKQLENKKLERTDLQVRFPTDRSYADVRKYHETMLIKARQEITKPESAQDFASRLISAVCFGGSSEKMQEARLILEEAMYRAANLMADEPSDEVYQLNIQLFPLSKSASPSKSRK